MEDVIEIEDKTHSEISVYPKIMKVQDLFEKRLDILGKPRRNFYELLTNAVTDSNEKKELSYLLSNEGKKEFEMLRNGETVTYLDLLNKYQSCLNHLSIAHILQFIPELRQRLYSIASSLEMHPDKIELFVAKNDWYTTQSNQYREG